MNLKVLLYLFLKMSCKVFSALTLPDLRMIYSPEFAFPQLYVYTTTTTSHHRLSSTTGKKKIAVFHN